MNSNSGKSIHGSIPYTLLRELGIDPAEVTDFSATVNPYPLPDAVNRLLCGIDLSAYPDPECFEARSALAGHLGCDIGQIVMATGTTELLFTLPLLFENAVCFSPTYGDYGAAFARNGTRINALPYFAPLQDFQPVLGRLTAMPPDLLIICNPNNPTGDYTGPDRIAEVCRALPKSVVCIDESYQELGDGCESVCGMTSEFDNLLVIKSLSKPYGIGGIRAGYAVTSPEICGRIGEKLLPWGVSTPAQKMVPVLISLTGHFMKLWDTTLGEKMKMAGRLEKEGITVRAGQAPFFLAKTGDAASMRMNLLTRHNVLVRDCTSFGMPDTIRIMPSLPEQNERLINSINKEFRRRSS